MDARRSTSPPPRAARDASRVVVVDVVVREFVRNARARGATAALLAARSNKPSAFAILLAHGADRSCPTTTGTRVYTSPLWRARVTCFCSRRARVFATVGIRARFATSNARGERPIHLAARGGSVRMVRCLLDRGADVAAEDDAGRNALLAACEADSIRVATLVLAHAFEHGVDPVDVDAYYAPRDFDG